MVPTSKCLDVGDHICAVVYTTSYVRQILVGAVYYTARTYIGHEDRSSVHPPLSTLLPLYPPSIHPLYSPPLHPLSTLFIYALKIRCLTRFNICIELQLQCTQIFYNLFKNITIIFMGSKSHKLNWSLLKKKAPWLDSQQAPWLDSQQAP